MAYLISDTVDALNLKAFYEPYEGDGRRNSPYEPRMLVKVLLYAYANGTFSSRRIARKLEEDVAYRVLAAANFPAHRTICEFRQQQLQTRDRLEVALAFYMIIAWRVLYLVLLGRTVPELSCEAVFAPQEWKAVFIVMEKKRPPENAPLLGEFLSRMARLGGYLARKGDGPPGPKAIWIGLQRTRDFVIALDAVGALS